MKTNILAIAAVLVAAFCMNISDVQAQSCTHCEPTVVSGGLLAGGVGGPSIDADGRVQPQTELIYPEATLIHAVRDQFSPNPIYAYSPAGLQAGFVHAWNQQQQHSHSWHGGYNTWRYQQPTAVVVPPTASFQSSYSWGVGQTRSTPIHHQFGRGGISSGGASGGYQNAPRHPWSTDQFGYYPVRSTW